MNSEALKAKADGLYLAAQIAESQDGWGGVSAPSLVNHIAKEIRAAAERLIKQGKTP